mgnify:CR=1 FL=1
MTAIESGYLAWLLVALIAVIVCAVVAVMQRMLAKEWAALARTVLTENMRLRASNARLAETVRRAQRLGLVIDEPESVILGGRDGEND